MVRAVADISQSNVLFSRCDEYCAVTRCFNLPWKLPFMSFVLLVLYFNNRNIIRVKIAYSIMDKNDWLPSYECIIYCKIFKYMTNVYACPCIYQLHWFTHRGRETQLCVSEHANIGSDNGLSPNRRQTIILTNAGILLIELLGTNSNENLIEIHTFSIKKMHLKMSSGKWRPFFLGLNVLTRLDDRLYPYDNYIYVKYIQQNILTV